LLANIKRLNTKYLNFFMCIVLIYNGWIEIFY
jgi:hypothetical protein